MKGTLKMNESDFRSFQAFVLVRSFILYETTAATLRILIKHFYCNGLKIFICLKRKQ